jgi:hypothetical protein
MGVALVKNNAYSTLAATITSSDTTLNVAVGTGVRFPAITSGSGDFFFLTLLDTSNNIEIVKVTATSTDTFTVVRGQDGTTARGYAATSRAELRPTQGLFDDKVSVGGGTLTGHLEAPANAAGDQVPRVSEVVKKSGDTMTGALIVPELRGPSNEIVIPSGERIVGDVAGSLAAPGMVVQTVHVLVEAQNAYSAPVGGEIEVEEFAISITPKYNNSKIYLTLMISGESSESNFTWRLKRNGNSIANNSTVSGRWVGWVPGAYDGNNTTTPECNTYHYMDSPASTSAQQYRLYMAPSGASAVTYRVNRGYNNGASDDNEVVTSMIMLQEIAQ